MQDAEANTNQKRRRPEEPKIDAADDIEKAPQGGWD